MSSAVATGARRSVRHGRGRARCDTLIGMSGYHEYDGYPASAEVGGPTRRAALAARSRDAVWVTVVALVPVLVLVVSILGDLFGAGLGSAAADVFAMWQFVGVFGLLLFGPVIAVSLLGTAALGADRFRVGRWLASIGALGAVLVHAAVVFVVLADVVSPPEWRDPNSWGPVLTPVTGFVVVIPYVVGGLGSAHVVGRLWRRRRSR